MNWQPLRSLARAAGVPLALGIAGAAALFAATRPGARFDHTLPALQFIGEPPGPGHRNAPNSRHPERVLRVAGL